MEYKKIKNGLGEDNDSIIKRIDDGAFIPNNEKNRDWKEYQAWLADGNEPEEAD